MDTTYYVLDEDTLSGLQDFCELRAESGDPSARILLRAARKTRILCNTAGFQAKIRILMEPDVSEQT